MKPLRILAIEPYYGGSHRAVLDGLAARVDARWTLLTLPARKWKWRMRGAAITMAAEARSLAGTGSPTEGPTASAPYDLILSSTFLNLAEFRGLAGPAFSAVPALVYFHENQLVYPNRRTAEWDYQFPLTNITTALAADECAFNSEWNLDSFLDAIPGFLREFPDHHPADVAERIRAKSRVLAPPFDATDFDAALVTRGRVPRIVWPHRWEHDKNPSDFFLAVECLAAEGLDFEVAIAGQSFRDVPEPIQDAQRSLGNRLVHLGEPQSRGEYAALLSGCDVAVSTALNEFFGIAMIEAAYAGCFPLVPDRLAYRELYPPAHRYRDIDDLTARLRDSVLSPPAPLQARALAERFTFDTLLEHYSACFSRLAERGAG